MTGREDDAAVEGEVLDGRADAGAGAGAGEGRAGASRTLVGRIFDDACLLAISLRDPRTGNGPKLAVAAMLVYLVSPVDVIPDVLPLLGIADDALVVPMLAQGALRLVPREVREEVQERVDSGELRRRALRWVAIVAAIWLVVAATAMTMAWRALH